MIVAQAPDLMFLKDTDGDDKADIRDPRPRAASTRPTRTTPPTASSSIRAARSTSRKGPSTTRRSRRPTARRCATPTPASTATSRGRRSSTSTSPTASPIRTATSSTTGARTSSSTAPAPIRTTAALFSGHVDYPHKHHAARRRSISSGRGPAPASRSSRSRHFPDECQGNLLVANVIGFQGILRYKLHDKGASFDGTEELEPIVIVHRSELPARPTSRSGPDGAIYFIDWHNPIIGHMQHNLRDPSRDRTHGRIYRVTYDGRPLSQAREDRRRADREAARHAQGARRPRPLPRPDRADRPPDATRSSPRPRSGSPASTRTMPTTSTTCWKRSGCIRATTSSTRTLLEADAGLARLPRPGGGDARPLLLARPRPGAARAPAASRPTTSIRASGSKRSGPPASSPCPRRSKCR